ncbi:MAG: glycine cleavage system aminomethyltransferase GcvT [Spirochaetaceae bacterium]|nr:glycine cleavage system aminomethyltransferase GcvT [Spirochaetaceae bacterium]
MIFQEAPTNTTALHDWHLAHGAKMAPFAGYDMPISYPTGAIEEHAITRRSVGLFDIDHMGQVEVSGPGADAFVSKLVSAKVTDMQPPMARYSLLLDEAGLVIDDLFVYRLPHSWWIVVNASNRQTDLDWFRSHAGADVTITDRSDDTYMIAVQGPKAIELLDRLAKPEVSRLERFTWGNISMGGVPILFGRTGYTGEDGGELFFPADKAEFVWTRLLDQGTQLGIETKPIGLAARDSLRFEAGMPLHGHEISPKINALEACFKWACDFDKDFIGKAALQAIAEKGLSRKLVGVEVFGGVQREGYEIVDSTGTTVGHCVAGMFCPTVKKYAANAFVRTDLAKVGTPLKVIIRGQAKDAVVVKRPLYIPAYRR